jgi:DNA gyrase subunit A
MPVARAPSTFATTSSMKTASCGLKPPVRQINSKIAASGFQHPTCPDTMKSRKRPTNGWRSYLDYAMSVIVSARAAGRARRPEAGAPPHPLFDARAGGYDWNKPYRKSARVVGDVMGKYHPHGDARSTTPGAHGAGLLDAPAADRRAGQFRLGRRRSAGGHALHRSAPGQGRASLLDDIDKDTVDFQPNYDGSEKRAVGPAGAFPNLLVNGAGGIAVGMATNIPPHNLGE